MDGLYNRLTKFLRWLISILAIFSIPLIMKYPPISSASSWCFTNSFGFIPHNEHLLDWIQCKFTACIFVKCFSKMFYPLNERQYALFHIVPFRQTEDEFLMEDGGGGEIESYFLFPSIMGADIKYYLDHNRYISYSSCNFSHYGTIYFPLTSYC